MMLWRLFVIYRFTWQRGSNTKKAHLSHVARSVRLFVLVNSSDQASVEVPAEVHPALNTPFPIVSWLMNFCMPLVVTASSSCSRAASGTWVNSAKTAWLSFGPMAKAFARLVADCQSWHKIRMKIKHPDSLSRKHKQEAHIQTITQHPHSFIWVSTPPHPALLRMRTCLKKLKQWGGLRVFSFTKAAPGNQKVASHTAHARKITALVTSKWKVTCVLGLPSPVCARLWRSQNSRRWFRTVPTVAGWSKTWL